MLKEMTKMHLVVQHFNLPNHSYKRMAVYGTSLHVHHGNTESDKSLELKLIFQISTVNPQ